MGISLGGWIEVYDPNWKDDGIAMWQGVIRVHPVLNGLQDKEMWNFLFDYHSGEYERKTGVKPLTSNRKKPDDLSEEAINEEHYLSFRLWILWSEIKNAGWAIDGESEYDSVQDLELTWIHLFKMMAMLAETYGDDNVRFVAGFD